MGLHHRKLIPEICQQICHVGVPCSSDCKICLKVCLTNPQFSYYPPPPPPPLPVPPIYLDGDEHERKHLKISTFLSFTLALLVTIFFVFCCREIYTRFWNRSGRRGLSSRQQTGDTRDDLLDEELGPVVVDHPIWYIRTPGLRQSIISAIAVCKYKKGEGLIEGTECSVCLSEFQEDENLRLLPKCRHAFHLPCIDTWLRSHTNCPMCRAPIVVNPARVPSFEPNSVNSSSLGNTHMEILQNRGETSDGNGMENSGPELRNRSEEECQLEVENGTGTRGCETESSAAEVLSIQPRRSVSLDSSSAAKINLALATVLSVESEGNSNGLLGDANEPNVSKRVTGNENLPAAAKGSSSFRTIYLQGVPSSMKKSRSYNGVHLLSWYGRGQKKPNAPLRSF